MRYEATAVDLAALGALAASRIGLAEQRLVELLEVSGVPAADARAALDRLLRRGHVEARARATDCWP